jgi:thiol-disulfide isomerase/thioredoxin
LAAAERGVTREGEGPRRSALDTRERKAFDAATWAKLSDWKNGKALTGTDTAGKVVLIVTWTDYLPTGKRAVQTATRIAEKHPGDVVVVMAHAASDWENAKTPAPSTGTLLVAHDAKGEFRAALNADMDPDFYILDRAGNLRYADVVAESVDAGVAYLVKESKEDAANITGRLTDEAAKIDREFKRATAINAEGTFVQIPELPFTKPSEAEYQAAKWPPRPADESKLQQDPKAELPTKQIPLPTLGWHPRKPDTDGRIVMMYEWSPYIPATYEQLMPQMDRLQRQYGRDVVVIGVMVNFEKVGNRQLTAEERDPKLLLEKFDKVLPTFQFEHYLASSFESEPYKVINADGVTPYPALMILSSDGYCRWWQHDKAKINGFAAVDDLLRVDPGVQARRKAEAEWLKAHKGGK